MALILLGLLILLQSPRILVAGSIHNLAKVCGDDQVVYSENSDGYYLSLNQSRIEDPVLACEMLKSYSVDGCFLCDSQSEEWLRISKKYCGGDFDLSHHGDCKPNFVGFRQKVPRKLLPRVPVNALNLQYPGEISDSERDAQDHNVSSESEDNTLAVPGMVLLCVGFLCPCFRPRKRDTGDHIIVSNQLNPALLERRGRLPQHTYLDYSITNLLAAVFIALTFGQIGDGKPDMPNFFTQLAQICERLRNSRTESR